MNNLGTVAADGLVSRQFPPHIPGMDQAKPTTKLLEVTVTARGETSWEWQLSRSDQVLVVGFERTRMAANFAGNDALFLALASGTIT